MLLALETVGGRRPDVGRCVLAEELRVAVERALVPVGELGILGRTSLAWAVVKRLPQNFRAELTPIGLGVEQVQVPRLIDRVRGRDRMSCPDGEEEKAPIFLEDARGEAGRPAVLIGEPGGEVVGRFRGIDAKLAEFRPQWIGECRPVVVAEGGGCLSAAAFLFLATNLVPVLERFVCIHTFVFLRRTASVGPVSGPN